MISDGDLDRIAAWLSAHGAAAIADEIVPDWHPARAWGDGELRELIEILANGGHLPLLAALVLRTRAENTTIFPQDLARVLGNALAWWDREMHRLRGGVAESRDLFMCYAHEDAHRVDRISSVLRDAGFSLFRDTESIPLGVSIAAAVTTAVEHCRAAVVVVSAASAASPWVAREVAMLMPGRTSGVRPLFPIVIDDIPLPAWARDLFAIDLRGLDSSTLNEIEERLAPLIEKARMTCRWSVTSATAGRRKTSR